MQAMAAAKTKWQQKRESTYEALLTAAMHCFHDHGYAATRVEDIVEAAGFTSGAFYFHFANKKECFFRVLDFRERARGDWWTLVASYSPEDTELLTVLVDVFARFDETLQHTPAWTLVVVDFFQQHRADPETIRQLQASYGRWQAEGARFIRALQDGGWISADRDATELASSVVGYVEGLTSHQVIFDIDRDTHQRILATGLLALLADP
jgi:AcrR family transcriptional regulator